MIYMFLSNNPSSGDINSSNLSCYTFDVFVMDTLFPFCIKSHSMTKTMANCELIADFAHFLPTGWMKTCFRERCQLLIETYCF